ncbi:Cytoskeleton assembly control protein sla1 [Lasiodiplodia theobromae]|uniref:Actin cytoskeleton-regulatory complex protein SLA1 n=1 Tax=Lasiodiplodia theobromae TaxID=45133 RepID=A0A5N5D807_9PEZI|nr:Cytoskeleton assembly control protein sla1 [Lasiodiplodia theobromae]KAB2573943.1 Actin cytoskeleton-regulatory complex protein sla1 [Lasiodiplodia theobromae]KAF4538298.1 Cytoskeleton assembly control protein sla1 [Lasiodiplodia theobromae]
MAFLGVYRAIYDYAPQGEGELELKDGDLLFVLEKDSDDDWWKAKKKAATDDEEEPEGLIPNNYVEEAQPLAKAKALYDYTRQTDEELSFTEEAVLDVYDTSDPDWTLVGLKGEFGFAPANYIDITETLEAEEQAPPPPARPRLPDPEPEEEEPAAPTPPSPAAATESPAAALAGLIQQKTGQAQAAAPQRTVVSPPPAISLPPRQPQYTPEESEEEPPAPRLPQRPISQVSSQPSPIPTPTFPNRESSSRSPPGGVMPSPPYNRASHPRVEWDDDVIKKDVKVPQGYHLYNIHEMVSHMGKSKKMPMTLGINIPKGLIMIAPEKSRDGPQREWTADKMQHYSIEGKHVFMDLVRPSKSVDFHAGAKDTAQEIVAMLGELAGAARGEGLREVLAAASGGTGQKKGKILYEFMAQGDDEVTVAEGDDVIVLDDAKSDEWWMVRRLKNGREGVVPASYVEITGYIASKEDPGVLQARSTVEQNRLDEERMAKEAMMKKKRESEMRAAERSKRDSSASRSSTAKPKPDPGKTRTWTDRTGSFKVEAEFIGLKDGKIHLHKLNGVKIAVPVPKMSVEDLEYVERATGVSLDEDKPLSDIKRRNTTKEGRENRSSSAPRAGITIGLPEPTYDWFQFFLDCGVNPQICERYAQSFAKDQMGEENLPDISEKLLRTLGLKEGDILRVMKFLDNKYGRTGENQKRGDDAGDDEGANGGLFAGPGGALKNNTRKGRPAPAVQTNDVIDPEALKAKTADDVKKDATGASSGAGEKTPGGFDDNAWEVKPSKQPEQPATSEPATTAATPATTAPAPAPPTGAMAELSILTPPLEPTPAPPPATTAPAAAPAAAPAQVPQPTGPQGATPGLFEQVANLPQAPPRARPQAPQQTGANPLIAPPPQRSSSAPQNYNQFGPPQPIQPQMTGMPAPPGQSLQELQNQQRMQQFQQQQMAMQHQPNGFMQPQQTGFPGQFGHQGPLMPQQTGFMQPQPTGFQGQFGQGPQMGNQFGSPFADPTPRPNSFAPGMPMQPQPTGFGHPGGFQPQPLQPQATGVNAFLPAALTPQRTGATGTWNNNSNFQAPPVPPIPQQQTAAPLVPQKTGPPPPVRFGVSPSAKKLAAQPTGRRANLSQATPDNPFGF